MMNMIETTIVQFSKGAVVISQRFSLILYKLDSETTVNSIAEKNVDYR